MKNFSLKYITQWKNQNLRKKFRNTLISSHGPQAINSGFLCSESMPSIWETSGSKMHPWLLQQATSQPLPTKKAAEINPWPAGIKSNPDILQAGTHTDRQAILQGPQTTQNISKITSFAILFRGRLWQIPTEFVLALSNRQLPSSNLTDNEQAVASSRDLPYQTFFFCQNVAKMRSEPEIKHPL